jgi:hypothetical protein
VTGANPVPPHAGHLISVEFVDGCFAGFFIATFHSKPSAGVCSADGFSDWVREMSGVFNLRGLSAFATKVAR